MLKECVNAERLKTLIYPICFLYRHYMELQMKEMLFMWRRYFGQSVRAVETHDLGKLWESCRNILASVDRDIIDGLPEERRFEYTSSLNSLGDKIKKFAQWDPTSQSFRYPIDRRGRITNIDPKEIPISELKELIDDIQRKLEAIAIYISEYMEEPSPSKDGLDYLQAGMRKRSLGSDSYPFEETGDYANHGEEMSNDKDQLGDKGAL